MTQSQENINKMTNRASRLRIVGLSLLLLSFAAFIFFSTKQHKEIEKRDIIISNNDSTLLYINDSIKESKYLRDSLASLVAEVLRLRNEYKADSIEKYYSDTLVEYFKYYKNISRQGVTKSDKKYWKQFGRDKFLLTEPVQVFLDSIPIKAIAIGKQFQDGVNYQNLRIEIKFDTANKINSVRGYKLVEQ
jgi:hypothetical protein